MATPSRGQCADAAFRLMQIWVHPCSLSPQRHQSIRHDVVCGKASPGVVNDRPHYLGRVVEENVAIELKSKRPSSGIFEELLGFPQRDVSCVPLGCCSSHGATCCESNSATWRDMARASTTKHNSGCYKAQTAGNFLSLQIPCQCYCRHIRLQLYYDQYTTTTTIL